MTLLEVLFLLNTMGIGASIEKQCTTQLPPEILKIIAAKYAARYYPEFYWVQNRRPDKIFKLMNCTDTRYYNVLRKNYTLSHIVTYRGNKIFYDYELPEFSRPVVYIDFTLVVPFVFINFLKDDAGIDIQSLLKICFMIIDPRGIWLNKHINVDIIGKGLKCCSVKKLLSGDLKLI